MQSKLNEHWKPNKPVIFLDVDGVLSNVASVLAFGMPSPFKCRDNVGRFDPVSTELVKKLVELYDANIVLSSSWRSHIEPEKFSEVAFGFSDLVGGRTAIWDYKKDVPEDILALVDSDQTEGVQWYHRGFQIHDFVLRHNVQDYVIFDDQRDFLESQQDRFVNIDPEVGMTYLDFHKAREILSGEKLDKPIVIF